MVEMTVQRVGLRTEDGSPVVVLRDEYGERCLSVKVSTMHANALMRHQHRVPPFRPQTHEVLVAVLKALAAAVTGVYLDEWDGQDYQARLAILHSGRVRELAVSAPDAIVLAVRAGAAIFVAPKVLEQLGQACEREPETGETPGVRKPINAQADPEVFRRFINSLAPIDDLRKA